MSHKGNIQLTIIFTATPDLIAEGDRLFASHAVWMEESHHREGELALLRYNVAKGPELSNPLDPSSEPTGNICYVLLEVYKNQAGLDDHWQQGAGTWQDFGAFMEWAGSTNPTVLHAGEVVHSLW